jgi:hypothetical protein
MQKKEKGGFAGDISIRRGFKPSPRHFHGLLGRKTVKFMLTNSSASEEQK